MVERVLWPAYFDADRTRGEGRRVPLSVAVADPTVDEIAAAVRQVGYDATVEHGVAYSRTPTAPEGCVLVEGTDEESKNDVVQAVAAYVTALRE